jgi:prepilin-type processing-associated H-X9-DG protein
MFERLWELCQHIEPFIQEAFEQAKVEYPFADTFSLFAQIVKEMVDSSFALCFQPYVECSNRKREKALRLQIKAWAGNRLTKLQRKTIESQRNWQQETSLGNLILRIARKNAKKELIIRDALEDYQVAWTRLLKCYATECHNKGSYAWVDGHVVKGSKSGTYPLPNS